ncbi:MAG: 23S rRNA (adenine(2503)-C(2))-methyltransferase RlmN [Phycisphaerales bacterium]|nr:23S rRNA (adenine(2503)-C(2))-methyltransferase RlmN [Phycisphaerales bacterium]
MRQAPGENSTPSPQPPPRPPGPDPLGQTGHDFARAAAEARLMARPNALKAYRRLHRTGESPGLDLHLAPIAAVLREDGPEGEVIKFTQRVPATRAVTAAGDALPQDLRTESVLIPMLGRKGQRNYTLCVSSQVGCAMGCTFCETAQMGLIRSLTPAEIVGQWFAAAHIIGIAPRNIVFMGMGEPLDNFDNVTAAIAVLKDHDGPAVAISRITVSTVGRLDGLARLRQLIARPGWHRMGLAISVNAPTDAVRSAIMPINRAMPMDQLQKMLVEWPIYGGGKVCLEYVLIPGVNDAPEHARQLAEWVRPINERYREQTGGNSDRAIVNLIPYNPRRASPWPAPAEDDVDRFLGWLLDLGLYAKRRRTKGRDLMGACGQLGSEAIRKRRAVEVGVSLGTSGPAAP